jgi:hypothetical protein
MNQQNVISLYASVCDCRSKKCEDFQEIQNSPINGSPPRGFYTTATGQVEVMVVAKNPGHVLPSEASSYINLNGENLVKAHLDFSKKTFYKINELSKDERRSTTFHSNLLSYLTEILDVEEKLVFEKVAYTNLVKCSTNGNKQNILTTRSMDECYKNHLAREIEYFKPKVVFALGREVERYLKKFEKNGQFKVVYIKHPSYHYRKELRQGKIAEIKEKYKAFI